MQAWCAWAMGTSAAVLHSRHEGISDCRFRVLLFGSAGPAAFCAPLIGAGYLANRPARVVRASRRACRHHHHHRYNYHHHSQPTTTTTVSTSTTATIATAASAADNVTDSCCYLYRRRRCSHLTFPITVTTLSNPGVSKCIPDDCRRRCCSPLHHRLQPQCHNL